jgi:hypothetical protein
MMEIVFTMCVARIEEHISFKAADHTDQSGVSVLRPNAYPLSVARTG